MAGSRASNDGGLHPGIIRHDMDIVRRRSRWKLLAGKLATKGGRLARPLHANIRKTGKGSQQVVLPVTTSDFCDECHNTIAYYILAASISSIASIFELLPCMDEDIFDR